MSTEKTGTADPDKTAGQAAPVVPERGEVLKQFATEVLAASGQPPEPKAGETAGEKKPDAVAGKPDALSQTEQGNKTPEAKAGETPAVPGAEPEWTAEQLAWFDKRAAAQTPEEIAAAEAEAPEFTEDQRSWLQQQPDGEAPAAGAEGDEDHLKDDPELKGKLDAATQASINKRIGKEVAKTKEAKEKLTAVETELAQAKEQLAAKGPALPMPAQAGPLANVNNTQELGAVAQQAETALDQAEDLLTQLDEDPDGVATVLRTAKVELKNAEGAEEYTPERMAKYLKTVKANADRVLRREIPRRASFLKEADGYAAEALELIPELKDAKSERRKSFDKLAAQAPFLKQFAWWPRAIALQTLGLEVYQKIQAAKNGGDKTAKRAKRPLPPTIPSTRFQPASVRQAKAAEVDQGTVDKALNGDKKARLKFIQTLVPKS